MRARADRVGPGSARARWTAAVAGGLLLVAGAGSLFRMPAAPPAPAAGLRPSVGLISADTRARDPVFAEDAEFEDPTPLFMPTRWNTLQRELPRREAGDSFHAYAARFVFPAHTLNVDPLQLPQAISVPAGAPEALAVDPPGNPSLGIGRKDVRLPPLPSRQARVEVVAAASGRRVWQVDVPPGAISALKGREWQPLELLAVADAGGLVGPLMATTHLADSAGNYFPPLEKEELSGLENYLMHDLLLGVRLDPGFYRISVGP